MKINKLTLFSLGLFAASSAQAISISSMFEFATNNSTNFTITNDEDYRQFIQAHITRINVENGKLTETPYTRENINDWRLTITPGKTVIDPKVRKDFRVTYKPAASDKQDKDVVYKLSFVPSPYFRGEKPKDFVQIAIGFAPYFIVPAKTDQPLNYTIERNQGKVELVNKGGTYIRANFDACPEDNKLTEEQTKRCSQTVYALSGRKLNVDLNEEIKKAPKVKVSLSTHFDRYRSNLSLAQKQKFSS